MGFEQYHEVFKGKCVRRSSWSSLFYNWWRKHGANIYENAFSELQGILRIIHLFNENIAMATEVQTSNETIVSIPTAGARNKCSNQRRTAEMTANLLSM